jgi:2-amino-4-hydroxy-6-hydroxymethyldihydropteridine diphosphokinase
MHTAELSLPHPEMQSRRFVLEPLAEIAPGWVHPGLGLTVQEILTRLAG